MKFTKLLVAFSLMFLVGISTALGQSEEQKEQILSEQLDYYQSNKTTLAQSGQMTKQELLARIDYYTSVINLVQNHGMTVDKAVSGMLAFANDASAKSSADGQSTYGSSASSSVTPYQDWWGTANVYKLPAPVYTALEQEVKSLF